MLSPDAISLFQTELLTWYQKHRRDLPWRRTSDPYAIWISEIMLQQTRVAAVIPYYERFLARFPSFESLAIAPESDLLGHWAGLGYYYRARNLHRAAQKMVCEGDFPSEYERIKALPGVGDYTAAAVASIAFQLPHPVVDGNVYRVVSRLLNDITDIASSKARVHFTKQLMPLFDRSHPGEFNQALMELGATVCLPKKPQCLLCPVRSHCQAFALGDPERLPVKTKAGRAGEELRQLFRIERGDKLLLWQRSPEMRLMPGFWELPEREQLGAEVVPERKLGSFRHSITVHNYRFELWSGIWTGTPGMNGLSWRSASEIADSPLSTVARKALGLQARHRMSKAG